MKLLLNFVHFIVIWILLSSIVSVALCANEDTTKKPEDTTKKPDETTKKPDETTKKPDDETTTKKPDETTTESTKPTGPTTTVAPSSGGDRKFDFPSFAGGIIISSGLIGIGYTMWRFYQNHQLRKLY